jgi:hypothetical protein
MTSVGQSVVGKGRGQGLSSLSTRNKAGTMLFLEHGEIADIEICARLEMLVEVKLKTGICSLYPPWIT